MRAVNEGTAEEAFRLIDENHAQLLEDRRTLQAVESALRDLEPTTAAERPATLRRDPLTGYRVSDESDVLSDWRSRPAARGRAMLTGAAELEGYLRRRG